MKNRTSLPFARRGPLIAWMAIAMAPFVVASTCFDTSTAPDIVIPTNDTGDVVDTNTTMLVAAPVFPDSGG